MLSIYKNKMPAYYTYLLINFVKLNPYDPKFISIYLHKKAKTYEITKEFIVQIELNLNRMSKFLYRIEVIVITYMEILPHFRFKNPNCGNIKKIAAE